jgi:hypothetical protein
MNSRLAIGVLIFGLGWTPALAQQTFTPPPPPVPVLPSIIPQTQAYTGCIMNCDTGAGSCQSACNIANMPDRTATSGVYESRTQCYLGCTSTLLQCKQTCPSPH